MQDIFVKKVQPADNPEPFCNTICSGKGVWGTVTPAVTNTSRLQVRMSLPAYGNINLSEGLRLASTKRRGTPARENAQNSIHTFRLVSSPDKCFI